MVTRRFYVIKTQNLKIYITKTQHLKKITKHLMTIDQQKHGRQNAHHKLNYKLFAYYPIASHLQSLLCISSYPPFFCRGNCANVRELGRVTTRGQNRYCHVIGDP
jgi:hypothetical protein